MRQTLRQKPSIRQKKAVKEEIKKPIKSKIPHAQATKRGADFGKICKRRFLYKIKFDKLTIDARMNMWHEMISALREEDMWALAAKCDFCGGQI